MISLKRDGIFWESSAARILLSLRCVIPFHKRAGADRASAAVATSLTRQSLHSVKPSRYSAWHKGQNMRRTLLQSEWHSSALCSGRRAAFCSSAWRGWGAGMTAGRLSDLCASSSVSSVLNLFCFWVSSNHKSPYLEFAPRGYDSSSHTTNDLEAVRDFVQERLRLAPRQAQVDQRCH